MSLIALPFQRQFYTYLPKNPIYADITVADLPISFHNLLNRQNGGYTLKSYIPTNRPTRDALNAVRITYFAGMFVQKHFPQYMIPSLFNQKQFFCRPFIPKRSIIFFEDQQRCAYLRYSEIDRSASPAVWYFDYTTQQSFELAVDFDTFLTLFERRHFPIERLPKDSYHIANNELLKVNALTTYSPLWKYVAHINNSDWINLWLKHKKI